MEDFADLYGQAGIDRDKKILAEKEARFEKRPSDKFGRLFEAIVIKQIEDNDLMGPKASVIIPSHFDDVVHGVDGIVEFRENQATSHLALAVDVTKSKLSLSKKFQMMRGAIDKESLATVHYFQSTAARFRGEITHVPHVVIGGDRETVDQISTLMLRAMRMKKTIAEHRRTGEKGSIAENMPKEFAKLRREIANHPLQGIILLEIKSQLEGFRDYALKRGKQIAADSFSRVLPIIDAIIAEKEENGQNINAVDYNDEIFFAIKEEIANL